MVWTIGIGYRAVVNKTTHTGRREPERGWAQSRFGHERVVTYVLRGIRIRIARGRRDA